MPRARSQAFGSRSASLTYLGSGLAWTSFVALSPSPPASPREGKEMWLERLGEAREPRALDACEQVGLDSAGEALCE